MKMRRIKITLILFILLLFLPFVKAVYIDYDDDWDYNEGASDDAAVWGGYYLDVGLNDLTSNADVECWDWDGDGEYSHCFFETGVSEYECDDNFNIKSEPNGDYVPLSDLYGGHCALGDGGCDHEINTGSSGQSWSLYVDAVYFEDCDGAASYTDVDNRKYWVVYGHQYDCDSDPGPSTDPDYEGYYGSWLNIYPNTGKCSASEECDENHDQIVSYTASATPSDPCRTKNGYSCSDNDDCISDHCVNYVCRPTDPYCGDSYCDTGETYSNCEEDCCDSDCTGWGSITCRATCDGYNGCSYYNSTTKSACDGETYVDSICLDSNTYVDCCEGAATDCNSGYYCSYGNCNYCGTMCDDICMSSACYGTDPDCDQSGNPTLTCCGDGDCDGSETVSSCSTDCCQSDCTATYDSTCHSECDWGGEGGCYLTAGCNGYSTGLRCLDGDTYVNCCEGTPVDCASGETCSNGQCILATDLAIVDVIPIQVIPNVNMVKGKSGYVRVIVHNYGPLDATALVNVTFDGNPLVPYNPANASKFIANGNNQTFDFNFKPEIAGNNKVISANVTIVN